MTDKSNNFENFLKQTDSANVVAVVETLTADLLTPLAVYLKLSRNAKHSFLLESVEGGESLGRYSFIGANPEMIVGGNDAQTFVLKNTETTTFEISLFDFLRNYFAGKKIGDVADSPAFGGGAIGFFGFSCAGWFEKTIKQTSAEVEDAKLMFFRHVVAFDHAKQIIKIIALVFTDEAETDAELKNLYENAVAENAKLKEILENQPIQIPNFKFQIPSSRSVESNWKREDFENAVREIKELISAGECYQVVLSQCFTRKTNADDVSIYRALRSLNPSPYMFLLKIGEQSIIGASPEMLVRCVDQKLEYRPIAGTRKRGATVEEDEFLAEEMQCDAKEVAEHLMLVDLGRNDLGRVAKFGSVKVENLMSVEKYSHVQHLVSYLHADLRDEFDCFDALAACFPAGTVSGAPKVRAIEIIQKLEPTKRGIYSGAVGYIDYSGNLDVCIAIRTLVLENGAARIQAGAGIVADSVPELEFEETVSKAQALLRTIEIAEGAA
ncbi:MAG: anthranilate synthase component I family protein [Pyrinomonadaceae bacterium]|nr:anthranilate synthase component I family protein [Pyrinomonadaceae bacterium]